MLNKQDILNALHFRHACKEFDPKKIITYEDFKFLLEVARLSPSSFGFEPWKIIVIQDGKLREMLKENAWGAPKKLDTASHFILILSMKKLLLKWDSAYVKYIMKEVQKFPETLIPARENLYKEFQELDFDLSSERNFFDWSSKQSYILLGNMMTAAAMIGIDSCPIEGFKKKETEEILEKHFGVNLSEYGLSTMVAFGYRVTEGKPKTRRKIEEIVEWK